MRARKTKLTWTGQAMMPHAPATQRVEPETSLLGRIKLAVSCVGGVHVMRNNSGAYKLASRFVQFGLGKGSSDLVAIVAPHGRWLCIEVKRTKGGVVTEEQEKWLAMMRNYGAVAGVVRSVEEALALVEEARR